MGDAESEHLLLASKRITNVQRNIRIPFTHSVHPLSSLYFPNQDSSYSQPQSNHHSVSTLKGKEREHYLHSTSTSTSTNNFGTGNYNSNSKELQEQVFNSLPEIPMTPGGGGRSRILIDITSPTYGMDNLLQAANILGPSPSSHENMVMNGKKRKLSPPLLGGGAGTTSASAGFFSALNVLANEAEEAQASQSTFSSVSTYNNSSTNPDAGFGGHYHNPLDKYVVPSSNSGAVGSAGGGGGGIGSGGGPGSRPNNQTRNRAPYIKVRLPSFSFLLLPSFSNLIFFFFFLFSRRFIVEFSRR